MKTLQNPQKANIPSDMLSIANGRLNDAKNSGAAAQMRNNPHSSSNIEKEKPINNAAAIKLEVVNARHYSPIIINTINYHIPSVPLSKHNSAQPKPQDSYNSQLLSNKEYEEINVNKSVVESKTLGSLRSSSNGQYNSQPKTIESEKPIHAKQFEKTAGFLQIKAPSKLLQQKDAFRQKDRNTVSERLFNAKAVLQTTEYASNRFSEHQDKSIKPSSVSKGNLELISGIIGQRVAANNPTSRMNLDEHQLNVLLKNNQSLMHKSDKQTSKKEGSQGTSFMENQKLTVVYEQNSLAQKSQNTIKSDVNSDAANQYDEQMAQVNPGRAVPVIRNLRSIIRGKSKKSQNSSKNESQILQDPESKTPSPRKRLMIRANKNSDEIKLNAKNDGDLKLNLKNDGDLNSNNKNDGDLSSNNKNNEEMSSNNKKNEEMRLNIKKNDEIRLNINNSDEIRLNINNNENLKFNFKISEIQETNNKSSVQFDLNHKNNEQFGSNHSNNDPSAQQASRNCKGVGVNFDQLTESSLEEGEALPEYQTLKNTDLDSNDIKQLHQFNYKSQRSHDDNDETQSDTKSFKKYSNVEASLPRTRPVAEPKQSKIAFSTDSSPHKDQQKRSLVGFKNKTKMSQDNSPKSNTSNLLEGNGQLKDNVQVKDGIQIKDDVDVQDSPNIRIIDSKQKHNKQIKMADQGTNYNDLEGQNGQDSSPIQRTQTAEDRGYLNKNKGNHTTNQKGSHRHNYQLVSSHRATTSVNKGKVEAYKSLNSNSGADDTLKKQSDLTSHQRNLLAELSLRHITPSMLKSPTGETMKRQNQHQQNELMKFCNQNRTSTQKSSRLTANADKNQVNFNDRLLRTQQSQENITTQNGENTPVNSSQIIASYRDQSSQLNPLHKLNRFKTMNSLYGQSIESVSPIMIAPNEQARNEQALNGVQPTFPLKKQNSPLKKGNSTGALAQRKINVPAQLQSGSKQSPAKPDYTPGKLSKAEILFQLKSKSQPQKQRTESSEKLSYLKLDEVANSGENKFEKNFEKHASLAQLDEDNTTKMGQTQGNYFTFENQSNINSQRVATDNCIQNDEQNQDPDGQYNGGGNQYNKQRDSRAQITKHNKKVVQSRRKTDNSQLQVHISNLSIQKSFNEEAPNAHANSYRNDVNNGEDYINERVGDKSNKSNKNNKNNKNIAHVDYEISPWSEEFSQDENAFF